jgi:hypothetical protein
MQLTDMADRPILITIIAVLTIIVAVLFILAGLGIAIGSEFLDAGGDLADIINLGIFAGLGLLILGLIMFVVGYGFLKGWTLFWYIGVIIYVFVVIFAIYTIIIGQPISVIELVIALIILFYLSRPKVREFFKV